MYLFVYIARNQLCSCIFWAKHRFVSIFFDFFYFSFFILLGGGFHTVIRVALQLPCQHHWMGYIYVYAFIAFTNNNFCCCCWCYTAMVIVTSLIVCVCTCIEHEWVTVRTYADIWLDGFLGARCCWCWYRPYTQFIHDSRFLFSFKSFERLLIWRSCNGLNLAHNYFAPSNFV